MCELSDICGALQYWSIPQPTCGPMPASSFEFEDEDVKEPPSLDELCYDAIRSLPSYIERSDLVLVLCPMVKHKDRDDYTW